MARREARCGIFHEIQKREYLANDGPDFSRQKESFTIQTGKNEGEWLVQILEKISVSQSKIYSFKEIKSDFEISLEDFELFWYSKPVNTLREFGLLVL